MSVFLFATRSQRSQPSIVGSFGGERDDARSIFGDRDVPRRLGSHISGTIARFVVSLSDAWNNDVE